MYQLIHFMNISAVIMKLGTLGTIGWLSPSRPHHVVFGNTAHDSTGGQPTASRGMDLAPMDESAGLLYCRQSPSF
jgi:hypothetical protein